jgi:hypothetical protein
MRYDLRELFQEAFEEWENRLPNEKPSWNSLVYRFFKQQLHSGIYDLVQSFGYCDWKVKASVGIGKWASVPWIGIRYRHGRQETVQKTKVKKLVSRFQNYGVYFFVYVFDVLGFVCGVEYGY